jgi:hypothetical protein
LFPSRYMRTSTGCSSVVYWLEYTLSECRECFCCELAWPEDWLRGEAQV